MGSRHARKSRHRLERQLPSGSWAVNAEWPLYPPAAEAHSNGPEAKLSSSKVRSANAFSCRVAALRLAGSLPIAKTSRVPGNWICRRLDKMVSLFRPMTSPGTRAVKRIDDAGGGQAVFVEQIGEVPPSGKTSRMPTRSKPASTPASASASATAEPRPPTIEWFSAATTRRRPSPGRPRRRRRVA